VIYGGGKRAPRSSSRNLLAHESRPDRAEEETLPVQSTPVWAFVCTLTLGAMPALGRAQVIYAEPTPQAFVLAQPGPAQTLSPEERARLEARTAEELESEPISLDPRIAALELELVIEQRNAIGVGAINALQWFGALIMIAGGVTALVGALIGAFVSIENDASGVFGGFCGGGLGGVALGAMLLGFAEIDGNLHRRRELDGRIRRLRRSGMVPRASVLGGGGVLTLSGTF
jgi:hypothetical protein